MEYRTYPVKRSGKEPLLAFLVEALEAEGCRIIKASEPSIAPFRISFETVWGERMGIVCYAFLANQKVTKNRPADEHRFQVKYGSEDGKRHRLWQDPYGLYTTLFAGINPEAGLIVGADPAMHSPTRFFISIEFKEAHAAQILSTGWHAWEREKKKDHPEPVEVLVGASKGRLLDYIRFERLASGLDPGHRQLLAEKVASGEAFKVPSLGGSAPAIAAAAAAAANLPHKLNTEFEMSTERLLDLIDSARRLKMAVRGWVAEEKLVDVLKTVDGVSECVRLDEEGGPDIRLRFEESDPLTIQCKNVLRQKLADGTIRLDFQKTRGSKDDNCTRFYRPEEFDLVAACLHAVTERWEFRYALPRTLAPHAKCHGRLSPGVRLDTRWQDDARSMLRAAAEA